jgi:hypothetical protein
LSKPLNIAGYRQLYADGLTVFSGFSRLKLPVIFSVIISVRNGETTQKEAKGSATLYGSLTLSGRVAGQAPD